MKEAGQLSDVPEKRVGKGVKMIRGIAAVLLLTLLAGSSYYLYTLETETCGICQRPLHGATTYRIDLLEGEFVDVCCPRCGLHFQEQNSGSVKQAWIGDLAVGERFPAEQAVYVEDSSVSHCCSLELPREDGSGTPYTLTWDRCLPGLVAFKDRRSALEFQQDRGGVIKSYQELFAAGHR